MNLKDQIKLDQNRESEEELEQYYRDIIAAVGRNGSGGSASDSGEGQPTEAVVTEPEIISGAEKEMGRENQGEGFRDGASKGEKRTLGERLAIYQEVVRQREQDKQVADQTNKRARGRSC